MARNINAAFEEELMNKMCVFDLNVHYGNLDLKVEQRGRPKNKAELKEMMEFDPC